MHIPEIRQKKGQIRESKRVRGEKEGGVSKKSKGAKEGGMEGRQSWITEGWEGEREREWGEREWATMPNEQERRRGSRTPSDEMR